MQQEKTRNTLYKPMCIAAAADNNYAQHLAVTFASVLKNNKGDIPEFFIIGDELTVENKDRLLETVKPFGATVKFLQADAELYRHASVSRHITRAAYLKVFIPELLPREVEKVIYLDCDVIVEEDLYALWNTDINGYHLGAALDINLDDRLHLLLDKPGLPHFNSGVMLLNLCKWREDDTFRVVLKFINESSEKLLYHDQDALNAILYNKWLSIDVKWNVQTHMFSPSVKIKFIDDISLRYALKKPHIIHYTGRGKPWHYIAVHPLRKNYYKYLEFTPWRGFRSKVTFRNILDGSGLIIKMVTPSLLMTIRRILIRRAISGSTICTRICNFLHIELHIESEQ
jgi:lipopolysaccharide biosynthesis glycosyltransferase